ncbi:MAG: hypothetical protein WBG02_19425 [Candidatus Acidiferrum sp.]
MKCRCVLLLAALVAASLVALYPVSAQKVSVTTLPATSGGATANLTFSKDGRMLREIQVVSGAGLGISRSVRGISYDTMTGLIRHVINLGSNTKFLSATPDGRTAIVLVGEDREDARAHLLLIDMVTERKQEIPSSWFNAVDQGPYAQISADGRLVSAYSERGPESGPLVVTVYDWRTRKLVAKRSEGYPAGGISWGGVTEDGKIEFLNNRAGGDVVDPKTGRLLVKVGPNSHRSPDGAWVIEYPNPMFAEAAQGLIIKNGQRGEVVGRLDLQIAGEEGNWAWGRGAFCGMSGRFIASTNDIVQAFEIPSGKEIADFPVATWQDADAIKTDPTATVACSPNGKRVAIRSGARLTLHDLN